jgi:integrase
MLERINLAIGHIRLDKLLPSHLIAFYNNLGEAGRVKNNFAVINPAMVDFKKAQKLPYTRISGQANVADKTVKKAFEGGKMDPEAAKKIAAALGFSYAEAFESVKNEEKLSGATLNRYHRLISSILQAAVEWQVIESNPARRVKAPRVSHTEAAYLEDEAVSRLVEALQGAPIKWKTIVLLLLYSGIRRGELCGLEWRDIDFGKKLISIKRTSQYIEGLGIIEKSPKNKSSERVMKLPDYIFDVLKQYKAWQNSERLKVGDYWHDIVEIKFADGSTETRKNERLFTQINGLPIDPNSVTRWVKKFQTANDLPKFTPHTLRHTNISMLIAANVPIRNIAQRAGHAKLSTTQDIYAHAFKKVDGMAADALANAIDPKARRN